MPRYYRFTYVPMDLDEVTDYLVLHDRAEDCAEEIEEDPDGFFDELVGDRDEFQGLMFNDYEELDELPSDVDHPFSIG